MHNLHEWTHIKNIQRSGWKSLYAVTTIHAPAMTTHALWVRSQSLTDRCRDPSTLAGIVVLQGDHLHTAKDEDQALRKKNGLGAYTRWSENGGVPAMRAEEAKGMQWLCAFCHTDQLEKSGSQANRYPVA